jgi:hypothetical protein
MCAAVSGVVKLKNAAFTCIVCAFAGDVKAGRSDRGA